MPPGDFQSAVNAAAAGGSVSVAPGSYTAVDISKKLDITAPGTIVDGYNAAGKSALRVHGAAAGSGVSGVSVQNALAQYFAGVMVDGSASDVRLSNINAIGSCFGIRSYSSPRTQITNFNVQHCAVGIGLWNNGGHTINGFTMDLLDLMVVDDTAPGNDNGGNGFQLSGLQDGALTTISNGTISNARAQSDDYVVDGGGIELFAAADVLVQDVLVRNCVNISETGTNPGKGDCARIHFNRVHAVGRPGTDHTQDLHVTCNGILGRNLVDSIVENCIFERIDWFCFDFTQGSKFDGSGTRNVTIRNNQFFLREGVDRVYSFGAVIPPGYVSTNNTIVAPLTATLALLNGVEYPATPDGFAAWQRASGLEQGSQLYTPEQWAILQNPPPPPPPPPPVVIPPQTPEEVINPVVTLILNHVLLPAAKYHNERAAINDLCKAYRDLYARQV